MEEKMEHLVRLQDCDNRIKRTEHRKSEGPGRIQELEDKYEAEKTGFQSKAGQIENFKQQRRGIERDVDDLENRIVKSQGKLDSIKSNKEYQAALKEIEDLKKRKAALEDQVLDLMEEMEAAEADRKAAEAKLQELKVAVEKGCDEVRSEMQALEQKLTELQKKRAALCKNIDRDLLKKYDFIGRYRNGLAVSSVIKGVCQTCHLGIPPQKFNELQRGDALMTCPHCNRIIYWGESKRFQTDAESN